MYLESPVINNLPQPREIRHKLGDALREVELLRALLKIAERAEHYRQNDQRMNKPPQERGKKNNVGRE